MKPGYGSINGRELQFISMRSGANVELILAMKEERMHLVMKNCPVSGSITNRRTERNPLTQTQTRPGIFSVRFLIIHTEDFYMEFLLLWIKALHSDIWVVVLRSRRSIRKMLWEHETLDGKESALFSVYLSQFCCGHTRTKEADSGDTS